ncbi:unnamed protein product [Choristocarpus tenellus]
MLVARSHVINASTAKDSGPSSGLALDRVKENSPFHEIVEPGMSQGENLASPGSGLCFRQPVNSVTVTKVGQTAQLMRSPHLSTSYNKSGVLNKFFGVTEDQALRTRALLRLGVTEYDVKVAERLMAERGLGNQTKVEWFLGYTETELSYRKALEVLGISEGVLEDERARRLGSLGLKTWSSIGANPSFSLCNEGDHGGGFLKTLRSYSHDISQRPLLGGMICSRGQHASLNQDCAIST